MYLVWLFFQTKKIFGMGLNMEITETNVMDASDELRRAITLLEKAVREHNHEKLPRLLRLTSQIRQTITKEQFHSIVMACTSSSSNELLMKFYSHLPEDMGTLPLPLNDDIMQVDGETTTTHDDVTPSVLSDDMMKMETGPEVDIYLLLLICSILVQHEKYDMALECAQALIEKTVVCNKRTMDMFTARAYAYLSLCHQKKNTLVSIRKTLLNAHRMACLRHDAVGQVSRKPSYV